MISHAFAGTANDVSYTFGYNKANQVTNRNINNVAYVFDGFKQEGNTDYASNGLNQYETVGETLAGEETVTPTSYTYDANANLVDTGIWLYSYDAENRLLEAKEAATSKTVRFRYDAKGRRIAKLIDDQLGASFTADATHEYLYERAGPWCQWHRVSPHSPKRQRRDEPILGREADVRSVARNVII